MANIDPGPRLAQAMPLPVPDELAELEARYRRGGTRAALLAFVLCERNHLPLPVWVSDYVISAIERYLASQYMFTSPIAGAYTAPPLTLDEAFMLPGPDPTPEEPGHEEPVEDSPPIQDPDEEETA